MPIVRYRMLFSIGAAISPVGTKIDIEYDQNGSIAQRALGMDAIWDWWDVGVSGGPAAKTWFSNGCELSTVRAQTIWPPPVSAVTEDDRANVAGTRAGLQLPPQNSFIVSLRTNIGARYARGRMYMPPVVETDVDQFGDVNNAVALGIVDAVVDLATELEAPARIQLPNTDADHIVASFGSTNPLSPPGSTEEVTTYLGADRLGTQRRRNTLPVTYIPAT